MKPTPYQIDLFDHVAGAYAQPESGRLTNDELYRIAAGRAGIGADALNATSPVGQAGTERSLLKRQIRWYQQDLRNMGVIQHVEGQRGVWELTEAGRSKLRKIRDDVAVLAFSTDLGVAILGNASHVFQRWDEPIFLVLTSPPYPLRMPRAYGNPPIEEYIDFVCRILEPMLKHLVPGGNVVLNVSNDIFESKSPARSTYLEELTLALVKRLGLHLMDRLVWASNKPPGPVQWASKMRMQLNTGYEPVLWFCNSPNECIADNRRVLQPHTNSHQKLIAQGGIERARRNGDGAYRLRPGAYGKPTEGRIPRNVLQFGNTCVDQRAHKLRVKNMGLPSHGAPMPLNLARFIVRWMTAVEQLVADPCFGSNTTGKACELEGRRWAGTEIVPQYARGAAERFTDCNGFELALDIHGEGQ